MHISSLASPFPTLFSFKSIFYWLCHYSFPNFFSPVYPLALHLPTLQPSPLSSCLWVVHISSLTSLFPTQFLTSPCLFYAYQLCFFFPVLPPPHSFPPPPPYWKPSLWSRFLWFHSCSSCLLSFCLCFLGSLVDSCEFVVILLFIVFYLLFLR